MMGFLSKIKIGNEQYPALTGVRAIGAIVVFFDHFPFQTGKHIVINVLSFFFVLSGFLIMHLYYTEKPFNRSWFLKYFANRFARIYPVYFLMASIAIYLNHNFDATLVLKNYTLTHALFDNTKDILINPSWSLTVEECFYLLAPAIIFLTARYSIFIPFLINTGLLVVALYVSKLHTSFLHTPEFVLTTTYFGYYFDFFAGAYLALIVSKKTVENGVAKSGIKLTVAGVAGITLIGGIISVSYDSQQQLNTIVLVLLNNVLLPIPIAIFFRGLITERSFLRKILSLRLLGFLGRTSYSFYLLHTLVIDYFATPYLAHYITNRDLLVITTFVVTLFISIMVYLLYEEPLNRKIRNSLYQRKAASVIK